MSRTGKQVRSALDSAVSDVEDLTDAIKEEAEKAGGSARTELAMRAEQLTEASRAIAAAVEPYRPPKRYRHYVQLGVVALIGAAIAAAVLRR